MAKNKISDLRDHLFETLEKLKDGEIEIERAQAIVGVSNAIIGTARAEIDLMKAVNASAPASAAFFGMPEDRQIAAVPSRKPSLDDESRELPESTTRLTRQMEAERSGRAAM